MLSFAIRKGQFSCSGPWTSAYPCERETNCALFRIDCNDIVRQKILLPLEYRKWNAENNFTKAIKTLLRFTHSMALKNRTDCTALRWHVLVSLSVGSRTHLSLHYWTGGVENCCKRVANSDRCKLV